MNWGVVVLLHGYIYISLSLSLYVYSLYFYITSKTHNQHPTTNDVILTTTLLTWLAILDTLIFRFLFACVCCLKFEFLNPFQFSLVVVFVLVFIANNNELFFAVLQIIFHSSSAYILHLMSVCMTWLWNYDDAFKLVKAKKKINKNHKIVIFALMLLNIAKARWIERMWELIKWRLTRRDHRRGDKQGTKII